MYNMFHDIALTSADVFTDILNHSLNKNKTVAGFYFILFWMSVCIIMDIFWFLLLEEL